MKRALVATLPPIYGLYGGEDQVGEFIRQALIEVGYGVVDVVFEEELHAMANYYHPHLIISNNAVCSLPVLDIEARSIFWHFNERITIDEARKLGWQEVWTNSSKVEHKTDGFLPLAADYSHLGQAVEFDPTGLIGYVGNWTTTKSEQEIDQFLVPFAQKNILKVWGGPKWKEHPVIKNCYQGPLSPKEWPRLNALADVWVNWPTWGQQQMGSINDRVYWTLAAGASIVSYGSPCDLYSDLIHYVCFVQDSDQWITEVMKQLDRKPTTDERLERIKFIKDNHLYVHRMKRLLS